MRSTHHIRNDNIALAGVALLAAGVGILAGGIGLPDRVLATGIAWAGSMMFFAIAHGVHH